MTDLFHESEPATEAEHESRGSGGRSHRRRQARRKAQRRRTTLTFVIMLAALALVVAGGWFLVQPLFNGPDTVETDATSNADYEGPGGDPTEVIVENGDTGDAIGQTLLDADVVASVGAFTAAYQANVDASSIQPGTYTLPTQIPASDAVAALLDPANRSNGLTIPEGWRATQIYERIAEVLEVPVEDVEAAAGEVTLPPEAEGNIEGWLFPSTYTPRSDDTPATILQSMVDTTVRVLENNDVPQESWHEVLVTASIIEREVARDEDRGNVAQVIQNRLEYCNDSGYLEMDSTLVYELRKPANEITNTEWNTPSDYNTREMVGLPPTAISSPGEASIVAAANPPAGDYCYFVTVDLDTGETKFTGDYQEFLEFRDEYRDWLDANR